MAKDLQVGWNSKEFCDVVLKVDGELLRVAMYLLLAGISIYGHKVILSRCWKTFIKDNGEKQRLKLNNNKRQEVLDFCYYLYTGKVSEDEEKLKSLLAMANSYSLPFLRQV